MTGMAHFDQAVVSQFNNAHAKKFCGSDLWNLLTSG